VRSVDGADPVGPDHYDDTDYFEKAPRLRDPGSHFQRYRIRMVRKIYRPGKEDRVLDLGCGWGTFTFAFAPDVNEIVGVDFSEKAIALCRRRARREGLENVTFLHADASDTGLQSESFDAVIAADLVEHLTPEQTEAVFDEAKRLLKRGGRFVLWTPHAGHFLEVLRNRTPILPRDPTHVDYKSMEDLRRLLLDRSFSVEKAYYAESHLPVLQDLERSLMSFTPLLRRRIAMLARKR